MGDRSWQLSFAPEVYDAMRRLAARKGVSPEEALVYALSMGAAATEAQLDGSRVLIETRGHVTELGVVA